MRLFIASPVILDDYASIKEDFKDIIEGKWVEEEHLHLTWVFLGEVADNKSIIEKMQNITHLHETIKVAELGFFGRPPKIFFAHAEEMTLYAKARECKEAGFDLYRFKPHITLCRIKAIHNYKAYKENMKTYREKSLGKILPAIMLYESKHTSEGLKYQVLYDTKN